MGADSFPVGESDAWPGWPWTWPTLMIGIDHPEQQGSIRLGQGLAESPRSGQPQAVPYKVAALL